MAYPHLKFWCQFSMITDPHWLLTQDPHHLRSRGPISLFLSSQLFQQGWAVCVGVSLCHCSLLSLTLPSVITFRYYPASRPVLKRKIRTHVLLSLFSPFCCSQGWIMVDSFYFLFISTSEITCGEGTIFILLLICYNWVLFKNMNL